MRFNRRDFLKVGLSGAALGTFGSIFKSPFLMKTLHAAGGGENPKKMIVMFLRGGNDAVNTCIPYGDSSYSTTSRPTIFIPEASAFDLGNSFAGLHPAMGNMFSVFQDGDLAICHRVAYEDQSRSHFDSQHYWENGVPGDNELEEGLLYRQVIHTMDYQNNPLVAASLSDQLMLLLKGEVVLPHIPSVSIYNLGISDPAQAAKLLGVAPGGGDSGSGLLGWYGQPESPLGYDALVKNTGLALGSSLTALEQSGVNPDTYMPENGAVYPANNTFYQRVRDAAMLIKLTDMNVACLDIGGFDTHSLQGGANGAQANLLAQVSLMFRSLQLDLQSIWDDVIVMAITEFGRTSDENESQGTDHGEAGITFVAGGSVNGGVYNCDALTWADGDMYSTPNARYVAHRTDYRAVFAEVLTGHFGVDAPTLDLIIPGYSSHAGDPLWANLGILP